MASYEFDEDEVIVGAGELYLDDINIGYTQQGISIAYDKKLLNITADQSKCVLGASRHELELILKTTILEVTLNMINTLWALNSGTAISTGTSSYINIGDSPFCDEPEHELLFVGPGPNCGTRRIQIYKVNAFEIGEYGHQKDIESQIPVIFRAIADLTKEKGQQFGKITDLDESYYN